MVKKTREKVAVIDLNKVEKYLKENREKFEEHIELEKERERKTMEKGMVYLINT